MKKTLNKTKNTLLQLLLWCFVITLSSAFLPFDSISSTSGTADEGVENRMHNNFTKCMDFNNSLHSIYSNKTYNNIPNDLMGLIMIDCPEDLVLNVDITGCTASGELPLPTNIQGLCGGNEFIAETSDGGILNVTGSLEDGDLSIFAQNLEPGTHNILYMVSDSCDNVFDCEFEVVVPPVLPTVVVKQNIVIALSSSSTTGEAMAKLYKESVDNGSFNPCGTTKLEIRREIDLCGIPGNATYNADGHPNDGDSDPSSADYDDDDGEFVKFCCEDITNTLYDVNGDGTNDIGYIKVWMRVWDDGDMDGLFGTAGDNYVEAWTFVKVEDALAPAITCPADVTLTCDMDYTDLNLTGNASAFTSCGEVEVEYNDIIINLDACNKGFLRRRYNVVGRSDIFCDQTITMEDLDIPVTVSFSQVVDFTATNCPDMVAIGKPIWEAGPCDVLGYTVDTDTFRFEDGACFKLERHLTVINWCDYKPNDSAWNGEGIWEHTQVIRIIDETPPSLEDCNNNDEVCESTLTLTNVAIDPGGENCPTDWLNWQVFVDLEGDGTLDLEYSSFLPPFDNDFNDTNGNGIPDIYLNPTNSEEEVVIQLPDNTEVLTLHKVSWKVTDGCNNVASCDTEFQISDPESPTGVCQDTITVGLAPIEPSTLWAANYILDAMDNCTSPEDIRFTFSASPPGDDPSYDSDRRSSNYELTLDDIANGFVQLPIYIWDENGNFTSCETVFMIDPDLILNTEETKETHTNTLYQNHPNPFRLSTSISFDLHRATPVILTFINAASAKTLEIEIEGKQGLNTYALDRELLSGQGLYFYTMTTKYSQETKKMILIH